MNPWLAYVLGLITPPIVYCLLYWLWYSIGVVEEYMEKWFGITVEFHTNRDPDGISDYTLRHDIWFERQRGPIFTGHWCREKNNVSYSGGVLTRTLATRWLGIGRASGRSVVFYKMEEISHG